MKKSTVAILEAVCLIVVVSAIAVVVSNHEKVIPALANLGANLNDAILTERNDAKKDLQNMMAEVPAPEEIDVSDEEMAEWIYGKIAAIYELAEKNNITLTEEQEKKLKDVIAVYDFTEEIIRMPAVQVAGGELSSGSYALKSDTTLNELDLTIPANAEVIIDLNGHTLTGTGKSSVITVENGGSLILKDSSFYPVFRGGSITGGTGTLTEGYGQGAYTAGGGIYVEGSLHMISGKIFDCSANTGGGVYIGEKGTFLLTGGSIDNCSIFGNKSVFGGGVQVSGGGTFQMEGGSIVNCTVNHDPKSDEQSFGGGGVGINNGKFVMKGGVISACTSDYHGGGIYVSDRTKEVSLVEGIIEECSAAVNGGGVYILDNDNVTMSGGKIQNCRASNGAAVCIQGAQANLNLQGGELIGFGGISNGEAAYDATNGGAVYVYSGSLHLSGGSIRDFHAEKNGGAIYLGNDANFTMTGGTLDKCTAQNHGGGVYMNGWHSTVSGGIISDCEAKNNGGGIYVLSGLLTYSGDAVIETCYAGGDMVILDETDEMSIWDGGGGIFVAPGAILRVNGGKITECKTAAFGGGIFCYGDFLCAGGEISNCFAYGGGGILLASEGSLTMSGGSVCSCRAINGNGGGISLSDGTLQITGRPIISENIRETETSVETNNLYLSDGQVFSITGQMSDGASIGVSVSPAAFTGGEIQITERGVGDYTNAAKYFFSDMEHTVVVADETNRYLKITYTD